MAQARPHAKTIVLVVEDEPLLRMLAVDVVEDAGFEAIEAANADLALTILESRPDIRIVFTDIEMPGGLNGITFAALVRDRWPPIDIIMTSGYVLAQDVVLPDRAVFFEKPYNPAKVTQVLQTMGGH